jgi:hypothetical protein
MHQDSRHSNISPYKTRLLTTWSRLLICNEGFCLKLVTWRQCMGSTSNSSWWFLAEFIIHRFSCSTPYNISSWKTVLNNLEKRATILPFDTAKYNESSWQGDVTWTTRWISRDEGLITEVYYLMTLSTGLTTGVYFLMMLSNGLITGVYYLTPSTGQIRKHIIWRRCQLDYLVILPMTYKVCPKSNENDLK